MNAKLSGDEVVAYSAMELCELNEYAAGIAAEHPEVRLRFVRASTAALTERLLKEGADGEWDVIFGLALTSMLHPQLQDSLAAISLPALAELPTAAVDAQSRWFCPSAFVPVFCVNHARLERYGLPAPTSWADLTKPCYRHELVLPHPSDSGAGYLHLAALIESGGEEAAWRVLLGVAENRPRIVHSAWAPCEAVGEGRVAIGVTVSIAAERLAQLGSPVRMIIPTDAAGIEPEGFAIRKHSPRKSTAVSAMNWMLNTAAAAIYKKYRKVPLVERYLGTDATATKTFLIDVAQAAASKPHNCSVWSETFSAYTSR